LLPKTAAGRRPFNFAKLGGANVLPRVSNPATTTNLNLLVCIADTRFRRKKKELKKGILKLMLWEVEAMVGGALARASAFRVGLGVSGAGIVSGSCACPSHLWMSHVLTSSSSLGSSSLFCRSTQCM
jgi:hypothetical protein